MDQAPHRNVETSSTRAPTRGVLRVVRISGACVVLAAGAALLVLPGPGWVVIALGLQLLARDVAWADRALARVRRRLPSTADGRLPRTLTVSIAAVALVSITATFWWFVV